MRRLLMTDGVLSRRSVLKRATAAAIGLAGATDALQLLPQFVAADDVALRTLADSLGVKIGTSFSSSLQDQQWKTIVGREFNLFAFSYGISWPQIEPQQGQFDFTVADRLVAFGQSNGMRLHGQPLIFPSITADWLTNLSRDDLIQATRNHITQVVGHFKDIIKEWVVVNESYNPPYIKKDIFYTTIGPEYIAMAFQAAREADPLAALIYNNDHNYTSNGIMTNVTTNVVSDLSSRGLIDSVGLEMHVDGSNPPNKDDVITTMQSYGVPVLITEFDVDLQKVPGSQDDRYALQAQIYRDMLAAALSSGVCKSFTVWGIRDKNSWLVKDRGEPNAAPTMYDDDLNPKPAYFAVRDVLSQFQPGQ